MTKRMLWAALGFLVLANSTGLAQTQAAQTPSLYKRLGGYDAVAAVTDDFIPRLVNDKVIGRYLVGLSNDSKARLRQLFVDQICAATGGPCVYVGRDMKTAHKGLGISGAEWDISVKHLVDTLDKFKVPEKEKSELLAAVSALKPDIVEKP